jgi:hypothetical protein
MNTKDPIKVDEALHILMNYEMFDTPIEKKDLKNIILLILKLAINQEKEDK